MCGVSSVHDDSPRLAWSWYSRPGSALRSANALETPPEDHGFVTGGVAQQERELVPLQPGDEVGLPGHGLQQRRQLDQRLVPHLVTEDVVQRPEPVDVDDGDTERRGRTLRERQMMPRLLHEPPAIEHTSEGIALGHRQPLRLGLRQPLPRHQSLDFRGRGSGEVLEQRHLVATPRHRRHVHRAERTQHVAGPQTQRRAGKRLATECPKAGQIVGVGGGTGIRDEHHAPAGHDAPGDGLRQWGATHLARLAVRAGQPGQVLASVIGEGHEGNAPAR